MSEVQEAPQRSGGLTAIIIVLAGFQILGLIFVGMLWADLANRNLPGQEFMLLAMVLTVVVLIGLFGIWRLQRWGVYLVGVLAAIGLVTDAIFGIPALALLLRLALLATLGLQIKKQWTSFR